MIERSTFQVNGNGLNPAGITPTDVASAAEKLIMNPSSDRSVGWLWFALWGIH